VSGQYLGDFVGDEIVPILFDTFGTNGESITLSGLATTDIQVYRITQTSPGYITDLRSSESGYFLLDTDGIDIGQTSPEVAGIHGFTINLGDNTDSGFFAAGNDYWVVVNAVLIGSPQQTVRFVAARFSIQNRFSGMSATAFGNLEDMFDGTGYTDDEAPAKQSQVAAIGSGGGSALNYAVTADNTAGAIFDSVTFVGSQTNTYTNTQSDTTTYHVIDDATNAFDIVYRVPVGATKAGVSLNVDAYLTGSNDQANIQVYDFVGSAWETLQVLSGTSGANNQEFIIPLFEKHTAPIGNSEQGNVYVRFVTSGQSNPSLGVARVFVSAISATSTMGYENGSVWVDESSGTSTGTSLGVDGTFANQSDDFDNGKTIADALGTSTITIRPGNSVTLSAALQGYTINNVQATLNGGSQNVDSTRFNGGFVTGTFGRAGTGVPTFSGCQVNNVTSDRVALLNGCGILGTFTLSEAGVYAINDAQAAGSTSLATIDFASLGGATVSLQRWSGDLTINNMASGDTLKLNSVSGGTITLNGADATVLISGVVGSVVNNLTGSPTVTDNSVDLDSVADAVWDESISTSSHNTDSSAGKRLRQAGTLLSAEGEVALASPDITSTTTFVTDLSEATDEHYTDQLMVFTSGDLTGQARIISSYNGTTKAVTFDEAWTDAPSSTDEFDILANHQHKLTDIANASANAVLNAGQLYEQNQSANIFVVMVDSTDHITRETGLVSTSPIAISAQRSIDSGDSFAAGTGTFTHVGNGVYRYAASADDMNGQDIVFRFSASGADPVEIAVRTYTDAS